MLGKFNEGKMLERRFCIAPMMDWTDRHCRFFHRLLTRRALIYTEMITTGAVLHGDRARLLAFDPAEHPVAVQLGGSDPGALAQSARICADIFARSDSRASMVARSVCTVRSSAAACFCISVRCCWAAASCWRVAASWPTVAAESCPT